VANGEIIVVPIRAIITEPIEAIYQCANWDDLLFCQIGRFVF